MTTHIDTDPIQDVTLPSSTIEKGHLLAPESKPKSRRRNKNRNQKSQSPQHQHQHSKQHAGVDTELSEPHRIQEPQGEYLTVTDESLNYIQNWNDDPHNFWMIQTIYKTSTKLHMYVNRKILQHDVLDNFEDSRVNDAVMKGIKVPTQEEYWMSTYKIEIKKLQQLFNNASVWLSNTLPDQKNNIVWGTAPTPQAVHDKDSQAYFIKKNQTQKPQSKRKPLESIAKFG